MPLLAALHGLGMSAAHAAAATELVHRVSTQMGKPR
jgi:hypothetical protein